MSNSPQYLDALTRIDAANADDPRTTVVDGVAIPDEILYARRMTQWLNRLAPEASEALRLATRAQHIRRWEIPRENYPMTREGYRAWREFLYQFHAETVGVILRESGYDDDTIARVQSLVRKERIKSDPEAQTLEDVACLVFLEFYLDSFVKEHTGDAEKIVTILRRTWKKMSPQGREAAMTLAFSDEAKKLIGQALAG